MYEKNKPPGIVSQMKIMLQNQDKIFAVFGKQCNIDDKTLQLEDLEKMHNDSKIKDTSSDPYLVEDSEGKLMFRRPLAERNLEGESDDELEEDKLLPKVDKKTPLGWKIYNIIAKFIPPLKWYFNFIVYLIVWKGSRIQTSLERYIW